MIRITPGQFSALVAFIVLLVGGGFLAGYVMGVRSASGPGINIPEAEPIAHEAREDTKAGIQSPPGDAPATTMTFYRELTEGKVEEKPVRKPEKKMKADTGTPPALRPAASSGGESEKSVTEIASGNGVMIQVGSYEQLDKAEGFLKGLSESGYHGAVNRADLGPRGIWYRVQLGPYPTEGHAREALEKIQRETSIKGFVVR